MKIIEGRVRIGPDFEGTGSFSTVTSFVETLGRIGEETGSTIQAFDATYVAGEEHLRMAVDRAGRARRREETIADDPAVEILLYAAGRRQIDQAMEMGVSAGDQPVVVVIVNGEEERAREAIEEHLTLSEVTPDPETIATFFHITERERRVTEADLETLVCERIALLDVEK